jgi:hypothetical protein
MDVQKFHINHQFGGMVLSDPNDTYFRALSQQLGQD